MPGTSYDGTGVVIAVMDTGFDRSHADFDNFDFALSITTFGMATSLPKR